MECRKPIREKAFVTTCSHLFCVECGSLHFDTQLACPACNTPLTLRDDIVINDLNPSEDYKASVLSGLCPDVICDILSRALSFWVYQTTQENKYQFLTKQQAEEKCISLERRSQQIVMEANEEFASNLLLMRN
jgi:E3 ubiquitin-protein ligase CCNP1IP1